MRRLEFLINQLRRSTDNTNTNGVTDAEIEEYYNDGQKLIQSMIFKINPKADLFKATEEYDYDSSGEYDLPEDVLAKNAISKVELRHGSEYSKIDNVTDSDKVYGYTLQDGKIVIDTDDVRSYDGIKVTYFRKLKRVSKRWASVATVNSGVSLIVANNDVLASEVDDYVTVVNSLGAQVVADILITNFSGTTWSTANALAGVTNAHYVCMGKDSVNACELPDDCETYLQDYVRQRIYGRNNYNDANKQVYFTDKQEADIAALFSNNSKDAQFPPITDTDMFTW